MKKMLEVLVLCMRIPFYCDGLAIFAKILQTASVTAMLSVSGPIEPQSNFLFDRKLLEVVRIIDQKDDDTITTANTNQEFLLYPIITLNMELENLSKAVSDKSTVDIVTFQKMLSSPQYQTPQLKKIFNRYADNIFYDNPDRANLYLGGGAVPDTRQTTQYLIRNDILNKIDDIRIDLDAITSNNPTSNQNKEYLSQLYLDTVDDCKQTLQSLREYLQFVDPKDIAIVKSLHFTTKARLVHEK